MKLFYYAIIVLHIFVMISVIVLPFLIFWNIKNTFYYTSSLLVILTIVSNILTGLRCPLTLIQRKIELNLLGVKKTYSFTYEIFKKIFPKIQPNFVKNIAFFYIIFDLFLITLQGFLR